METLVITAASVVSEADLQATRLGARFGRLDRQSKFALTAVEALGLDWTSRRRECIGICLSARAGSLSTDLLFWQRREAAGGPSPTVFAYTLPSAALGEIAIRYGLTGPNLCLVGPRAPVLTEAADAIREGEADAMVCVHCDVLTDEAGELLGENAAARACALFLERGGPPGHPLREIDRDIESVCALVCARNRAH